MASEVGICNRALQKLGAKRIVSLSEDSVNARACNNAYEALRDAELEDHPWLFAIKRDTLAADATAPDWGRANAFTLPSDFIRLLPPYPEDNLNDLDWIIENGKIYTDDSAPLYVRYIFRVTDPNAMHPLFRESLASKIAYELCEELTQSNQKKAAALTDYDDAVRKAKRSNAIQQPSAEGPTDTWITSRA